MLIPFQLNTLNLLISGCLIRIIYMALAKIATISHYFLFVYTIDHHLVYCRLQTCYFMKRISKRTESLVPRFYFRLYVLLQRIYVFRGSFKRSEWEILSVKRKKLIRAIHIHVVLDLKVLWFNVWCDGGDGSNCFQHQFIVYSIHLSLEIKLVEPNLFLTFLFRVWFSTDC